MDKKVKNAGSGVAIAEGIFRILLYLAIAFAIFYVGKAAYSFGYEIFNQQPMEQGDGKEVTVVIKQGISPYKIGKVLESKGLIDDPKIFMVQEKLSNYKGKLQPGTYILSTSMTADQIMAILAKEVTEGQPTQEEKGETQADDSK